MVHGLYIKKQHKSHKLWGFYITYIANRDLRIFEIISNWDLRIFYIYTNQDLRYTLLKEVNDHEKSRL